MPLTPLSLLSLSLSLGDTTMMPHQRTSGSCLLAVVLVLMSILAVQSASSEPTLGMHDTHNSDLVVVDLPPTTNAAGCSTTLPIQYEQCKRGTTKASARGKSGSDSDSSNSNNNNKNQMGVSEWELPMAYVVQWLQLDMGHVPDDADHDGRPDHAASLLPPSLPALLAIRLFDNSLLDYVAVVFNSLYLACLMICIKYV
jgi:hypothetical protein